MAAIVTIICLHYQTVEGQNGLTRTRYHTFLAMLEGSWLGKATITPVGPRPYDITFGFDDSKRLVGASRPGNVSTHYWTFYVEDNVLKLEFLSTFAGNRQPIHLTANTEEAGTWYFTTEDITFLEVRVRPQKRATRIQIYLRGEHHVEIELDRPE